MKKSWTHNTGTVPYMHCQACCSHMFFSRRSTCFQSWGCCSAQSRIECPKKKEVLRARWTLPSLTKIPIIMIIIRYLWLVNRKNTKKKEKKTEERTDLSFWLNPRRLFKKFHIVLLHSHAFRAGVQYNVILAISLFPLHRTEVFVGIDLFERQTCGPRKYYTHKLVLSSVLSLQCCGTKSFFVFSVFFCKIFLQHPQTTFPLSTKIRNTLENLLVFSICLVFFESPFLCSALSTRGMDVARLVHKINLWTCAVE